MKAYTYISEGNFELREKEKPVIMHERDAVVKVTLASICSSDLHIKHGSVPRAVPGITVGHEMVGTVEEIGSKVTNVKPGDRVTVNVETFCGDCFFCKNGFVNNCTDKTRMGTRLPNRRRTSRICSCAVCRPRAQQNSGQRYGQASAFCGRCSCNRLLGGTHFRNHEGRHSIDYRRRADGYLRSSLHHAEKSQTHHRV